jgi:hypothetical protein
VCGLQRPEGRAPEVVCTLGQTRVDAVRRATDYYEVSLPAGLLAAASPTIELQWVDQWR